jgi:hypothetical protein
VEQAGQCGQDLGREPPELLAVREGQAAEHGLAFRGDLDEHLPLVHLVPETAEQAERDHAVDEAHHRVVLELELPRQRPDRGEAVRGETLQGEEELVLPGPDPGGAGGVLAERQEAPDQVPEARQGVVVRLARRGRDGHRL